MVGRGAQQARRCWDDVSPVSEGIATCGHGSTAGRRLERLWNVLWRTLTLQPLVIGPSGRARVDIRTEAEYLPRGYSPRAAIGTR
eukprot:5868554-Prymnesium_polylepis.1